MHAIIMLIVVCFVKSMEECYCVGCYLVVYEINANIVLYYYKTNYKTCVANNLNYSTLKILINKKYKLRININFKKSMTKNHC